MVDVRETNECSERCTGGCRKQEKHVSKELGSGCVRSPGGFLMPYPIFAPDYTESGWPAMHLMCSSGWIATTKTGFWERSAAGSVRYLAEKSGTTITNTSIFLGKTLAILL